MATKKKALQKSVDVKKTTEKTHKYVVESGINLTSIRYKNTTDKFPFEQMKVGDSFLIPASDHVSKNPNVLHYAARAYAKIQPGFAITTRLQLNKDRRVWRLK